MFVLSKKIRPNMTLHLNSNGTSVNFVLDISGLDPLRPQQLTRASINPDVAAIILETEWEEPTAEPKP